MALNSVSPDIVRSVQDVGSLLLLIKEMLTRSSLDPKFCGKDFYLGYSLSQNGRCLGSIGINLHDPQWVFYTTDGIKINSAAAKEVVLPLSDFHEYGKSSYWTFTVDLTEAEGLFNKSVKEQIVWLKTELLDKCLAVAQVIVL